MHDPFRLRHFDIYFRWPPSIHILRSVSFILSMFYRYIQANATDLYRSNQIAHRPHCIIGCIDGTRASFVWLTCAWPLKYVYLIDKHVNEDYLEMHPTMEDACRIHMRRDRKWWQKARFERAIPITFDDVNTNVSSLTVACFVVGQ